MELQGSLLDRTWHHARFQDLGRLVALKQKKGLSISLAFPTLNEEATIGKEILVIKTELMDRYPLVDEIVVIDSSSQDKTRDIAKRFGAQVYESKAILASYGSYKGKGENLWKSLYVLKGDIIVWVDADISNISPKFVYALVGPLLEYDSIGYVKAFYERPMQSAKGIMPSGGGRVTEILVRPLFSLYYPELAYFIQPLSGEYAGRRTILERLSFSVGYGVELGHLLDLYHEYGMGIFAQVDLDIRVHRNQTTEALGKMAYGILRTFFNRAQRYGEAQILRDLHPYHLTLQVEGDQHRIQRHEIPSTERPPMIEIPEYQDRFKKNQVPKTSD